MGFLSVGTTAMTRRRCIQHPLQESDVLRGARAAITSETAKGTNTRQGLFDAALRNQPKRRSVELVQAIQVGLCVDRSRNARCFWYACGPMSAAASARPSRWQMEIVGA